MNLSYIDWLAFTSPMIKIFTLLVRKVLAAPLFVSVFTCFIGRAVCALDGLVVLLYSCCMACKQKQKLILNVYLNTTYEWSHLVITSHVLVSILSVFLATLKMERRESTSNL